MTLADTMNGPVWILYSVAALFITITVILISGNGSWLIAGYNTASKAEKEKYNEKRLCRVVGFGTGLIAVLLTIASLLNKQLPAGFAYVLAVFIILDAVIIIILGNTFCKK